MKMRIGLFGLVGCSFYKNNYKKFIVFKRMFKYFREVVDEAKRLTFPAKRDVYMTAINIVVIIFISALIVALTDVVISKVIKLLFGLGI